MKVSSSDLTSTRVLRNPAHIFLLKKDVTNFVDEVKTLTSKIKKEQEYCVRFAYEICSPVDLNLCNETSSYEVRNLSEILEKIQSNEKNLPTEKVLLIVPDDIEPKFVNELCQQLCLLQIPFEIQTKYYQEFVANPAQYLEELEELNKLQKLCEEYISVDKEINSLVTELLNATKNLKSLMKQDKNAPLLVGVGDFPFDFDSTFGSHKKQSELPSNAGCVFVLTDDNDDLRRLNEYNNLDKKNILFLLKKDASHLNISLHLAMTAQNLKNRGFGNACLTFVGDIELTEDIIRSFCSYLKLNAWDATAFKKTLEVLKDIFLKLQNKFSKFVEDSSHHTENKQMLTEKLHSGIKYLIDNEDLLFNDILPKALLYDSQQFLEIFRHEFQKKCRLILDEIAMSRYFDDENFLHQIYKGDTPKEFNLFLEQEEHSLYDMHTFMSMALQKSILDFFSKRMKELKKLLPTELVKQSDNELFDVEVDFVFSSRLDWWNNYFLNCLRNVLSAEKLKTLVRHNSKTLPTNVLNANNIIFLEVSFRKEIRQLLEIEFDSKMTSWQTRLTWEISSALKESWEKISAATHAKTESAKENFSSAVKESDAEGERLLAESNKFIKFWNAAQLATKKLQMLT